MRRSAFRLDKIESLNPRAVVASHKRPENDADLRALPRLVFPTQAPPRLAGATLPSMNVSCTLNRFSKLRLLRPRSPVRSYVTLKSSFLALVLTLSTLVDEAR